MSAAARSRIYGLLALALEYPTVELEELIATGELGTALRTSAAELGSAAPDLAQLAPDVSEAGTDELAVAYSALFDSGVPPPLSLNGSTYYRGMSQMKLFEDLQRFFEFVGLERRDGESEALDWLPLQLEAMHYLAFRESEASAGSDPDEREKLRALQLDLFRRHVGRWIVALGAGLEAQSSVRFYRELGAFLCAFGSAEAREFELPEPPRPRERARPASR